MKTGEKVAIFFSINYPFHYADSYVDEEVNLWAKNFDKVIIVSLNSDNSPARKTPANAEVVKFRPLVGFSHYLKAIAFLFSGLFRKELAFIAQSPDHRLTINTFKSVFKYYARALAYKEFLSEKINSLKNAEITVYSYFMLESMLAACLMKEEKNLLLISRLHGYDLYFERGEYGYLPFRNFFLEKIDRLFFISENGLEYFKNKLKVTEAGLLNKLNVARLGINSVSNPDLNFSPMKPLVLVSTSWILANKRLDIIARALSFLPSDRQVKWVHFGGIQSIDVDYANDFMALTNEILNLKKNIQIELMGNTLKEDIFKFLGKNYVHFFINVSASEGIPVSMMEASSFGIPLLGTLVGGVGEIIKDGHNGFHLQANLTPNYLSHRIQKILEMDETEYTALRKNAYQFWKDNFSAEKNYQWFDAEIRKLLQERFFA